MAEAGDLAMELQTEFGETLTCFRREGPRSRIASPTLYAQSAHFGSDTRHSEADAQIRPRRSPVRDGVSHAALKTHQL